MTKEQKQAIQNLNDITGELNKFMTWWEGHYEIKSPEDVRCDEIRPLYVTWKEWKKLNEQKQTSDETKTPVREEKNDTEIQTHVREEI